ncbi:MAG: hypothetical protein ACTSPI_10580, partial [Candidatus Heimdallarchaeaceae archaeon]
FVHGLVSDEIEFKKECAVVKDNKVYIYENKPDIEKWILDLVESRQQVLISEAAELMLEKFPYLSAAQNNLYERIKAITEAHEEIEVVEVRSGRRGRPPKALKWAGV